MNLQQVVQSRPSVNGFGHRRGDRDIGPRNESKTLYGKSSSINSGSINGIESGGFKSPSHDRVTYIMTHLIGHQIEVQVKDGSVISGIFHGMNACKDFEIVLKMAQVIKDGSTNGQKHVDTIKKPQTMIISSREFVQVIGKNVVLSSDEISGHSHEKRKDLMLDSVISYSRHMEVERELEPWMPDEGDPECPELENIFDKTWNRNWDQFETNKTLFGVKSSFNEELYTTKLERGPQMREIEREALRIAREIEGEETHDSHLAEERGMFFHDFDLDEESRYSAVHRNDGRFRPNEYSHMDNHFEVVRLADSAIPKAHSDVFFQIPKDETQTFSASSSLEDATSLGFLADNDDQFSASVDISDDIAKSSLSVGEEDSSLCSLDEKQIGYSDEKSLLDEDNDIMEPQALKSDEKYLAKNLRESSPSGPAYHPSSSSQRSKFSETSGSVLSSKSAALGDHVNSSARPGSSVSSSLNSAVATSGLGGPSLSPSSSIGSLSSEKSTLNPNAKEFKLNPNAKSFTPSSSLRPHVAVSEGAVYYGNNITIAPQMHGLPVGMMAPTYSHPHIYNPQMQSGQPYIHPNGPMYGQQQMVLGQSRPVYYVPTYSSETMPYKGRNF